MIRKTGGDNAFDKILGIDVAGASDGDVVLAPGKSWGTLGWGMSDTKTAKADTKQGVNTAIGMTFAREDVQPNAGKCETHFMLV